MYGVMSAYAWRLLGQHLYLAVNAFPAASETWQAKGGGVMGESESLHE
jgi:hypothetical protein